ncbi:deoxynucleoside kinase [Caldisalinibacter kiritimatiensis]|uniref:Deoxyadenosine kinase / Deoxyguanosine kinase n=1 Tax=Caldisalinibacter kiritimatiensis TaxID=1304284 RepID=R1CR06_9FIRM|nr:deoxynucleoside kinase [Caldisalinibacter kiritimatiensis]EOD01101.1 Deoxyadenosine kinase / Deoxyguanosine kinase [Caldisalinibacter kiritimatiensis]
MKKTSKKLNNVNIVIDGVVGVGKSTLLRILKEREGFTPLYEPVIDNPILHKFYSNMERYAFPLQVHFLNKKFRFIKESRKIKGKVVMDRSIYGDAIFAKMHLENGNMSKTEYELYYELFDNMMMNITPPTLVVYLEISVDKAIERIKLRGREYEMNVDRAYWERLNKHYTQLYNDFTEAPILKINVDNIDFENNKEHQDYVVGLIMNKIEEINRLAG